MIEESIAKLVQYGMEQGLLKQDDRIYAVNRILEVLKMDDYPEPGQVPEHPDLEETLNELLDYAAEKGLLEHNSIVYRPDSMNFIRKVRWRPPIISIS